MAKNLVQLDGYDVSVVCSDPTTPASGDPVRVGKLTGVAQTAESSGAAADLTGNPSGYTSVDFGQRIWSLSVKGVNDGGNSAVAVGDTIYYVDADTPKLSKKQTNQAVFGIALGAITSGATATINVLHVPVVS